MSNVDMVAGGSLGWKQLPKFYQFGVHWLMKLKVWLMRNNINHLGLEEHPK